MQYQRMLCTDVCDSADLEGHKTRKMDPRYFKNAAQDLRKEMVPMEHTFALLSFYFNHILKTNFE